jgi:hypothetical protein
MKLSALELEILLTIMRRPRTAGEIRDYVWQLYPQDAPQLPCIKVHICHINRKIAGSGWRIVCHTGNHIGQGRRGRDGPGTYCLERDFTVAIPLAADPRDLWAARNANSSPR